MERIPIRITALLVMTTLAACDFLDIDTPGIVNRDKMFENEQGFIAVSYTHLTLPTNSRV